jgi:Trp operon repressor
LIRAGEVRRTIARTRRTPVTQDLVKAITDLLQEGLTQVEVAVRLGIAQATVSRGALAPLHL